MKPDPDERIRKGLIKRTKPGLACLLVLVGVFVILRGIAVNEPIYLQNGLPLLTRRLGLQLSNSTVIPEVQHVAFLKVHKTGSSTIQNLLFRFGYKRKLSIALPTKGNKLSPDIPLLDPLKGKGYDILAIHSRFNESVFRSIVPNDSSYIGIVRDPFEVMVSSAYYHRYVWHVPYLQKIPADKFIESLIRFPEIYDQQEYSLTKNSMAEVFGFPKGLNLSDKSVIRNYLEYLGTIFRLVLITEHFNESLVLMKRYLKWRLEDLLYIPLNEYRHPSLKELNITSLDKSKFKERNYLDYEVYNFFYERLVNQISLETDILEEVKYFTSVQNKVQLFCLLDNTQFEGQGLRVRRSRWSEPFLVTKSDCDLMKMSELDLIERLREEQIQALVGEM